MIVFISWRWSRLFTSFFTCSFHLKVPPAVCSTRCSYLRPDGLKYYSPPFTPATFSFFSPWPDRQLKALGLRIVDDLFSHQSMEDTDSRSFCQLSQALGQSDDLQALGRRRRSLLSVDRRISGTRPFVNDHRLSVWPGPAFPLGESLLFSPSRRQVLTPALSRRLVMIKLL